MCVRGTIGGLALLALLTGCGREPRPGPPDAQYPLLADRVEEALEGVEEARAALAAERAPEAVERLAEASASLRRLHDYYLPVLAARAQVARASASPGPTAGLGAVDSAMAILEGVAGAHGEHLARELEEPLARLEAARTALEAGRADEARRVLERLDQRLELLYFRGELVLEGSALDSLPD